jgi:predicted dehydrogenase
MYIDALASTWKEKAELVAFCDTSPARMAYANARIEKKFAHPPVPAYSAADFDRMAAETRPDVVIVTTVDAFHHQYIVRAMELGKDVISEKPMTIDAPKARAIFDAIQKTGRKLTVTFNYRYSPGVTKMYETIRSGAIGRPLAVDFSWVLDTSHGADYFRRWHAEKKNSGGLLVHKATHHFDLVNWWIGSSPQKVFAFGDLKFYGKANAVSRGDEKYARYPRYTHHPEAQGDPFALFLDKPPDYEDVDVAELFGGLYLKAEADSGYIRDENVFSDRITIEDTMAVTARYRNGVIFNYSLIAYSPWEGYRASVTGDRGRLELFDRHGAHIIDSGSDGKPAAPPAVEKVRQLMHYPMFGRPREIAIPTAEGGHGGGDPLLLEQLFSPNPPADPYKRAASHLDGAASILMGIAANESIRTGQPVRVDDLLKLP